MRQSVQSGYGVGVGVAVRVGVASDDVGGVGVEVLVGVVVLVGVTVLVAVYAPITGSVAGPCVGVVRSTVGDGRTDATVGGKGETSGVVTVGEEDTGEVVRVSGAEVLPSGTTTMSTSGVAR